MVALTLVPLVGMFGMATEASSWYLVQRAAQNAADAAVMAAASNNCDPSATCHTTQLSPSYADEALAVAAKYNFTNGANNATVAALDGVTCPAPSTATNCYKVTVTKLMPISLLQIVGYKGDATVGGYSAQTIKAVAIASAITPDNDCMVTLSTSGGFSLSGGPMFTANGCNLFSNGTATCNGHNGGFGEAITVSTATTNCGVGTPVTGASVLADPYKYLASNIPPDPCKTSTGLTAPAIWNLSANTSSNPAVICGPLTIPAAGTTVTTAASGSVIVIEDANLTLNGTMTTTNVASGLTIIFSGTSGSAGFIAGNGTLEYSAPTSGTWSGVALYQDPAMKTLTNPTYTGNSPTFDMTGLIYAPYANLTFKGAINHDLRTGGQACLAFVSYTMQTNGTGSIFANPTSQCGAAGLAGLPTAPNTVKFRQALLQ